MKVVLDTNVLVSGLLCSFGAPGEIVRMAASGTLRLCYDARILFEYQDVLSRPKFSFDQTHVGYLLDQIETDGEVAAVEPLTKRLPDSDDEPFLEAALGGKARCLITGNLKDYPLKKRQGMLVVSPVEFLEIYRRRTDSQEFNFC
ncbi:MAG: putative toxin-antitoxin system toxin component, PIN family [Candidatus Omnitrophota bacterium]